MMFKKALKYGICSGMLLSVGWPPGWSFILLFAFVPLMIFLFDERTGIMPALIASFSAFIIWFAGSMYWIAMTSKQWSDVFLMSLSFLIVPLMMCLPVLIYKILDRLIKYKYMPFAFPLLWILYEYWQMHWDYGFIWLNFGLGFSSLPGFASLYYHFNPYIIACFVLVLSVFIALLFNWSRLGHRNIKPLIAGLGLCILCFIFAEIRTTHPKVLRQIKVAVFQPDTDVHQPLDEHSLYDQVMQLRKYIQSLKGSGVELVVCPEGYLRSRPQAPIILNDLANNNAIIEIQRLSAQINIPVICGLIGVRLYEQGEAAPKDAIRTQEGQNACLINCAVMITPDNQIQIIVKKKLVPFMERFPVSDLFHLSINQMKQSYCSDGKARLFKYKDMLIAPLICMDVVDHRYVSQMKAMGANIFVHISNDAWAGKEISARQNESYAKAAAQASGCALIRSNFAGFSGIVSPSGEIVDEMHWHQKGIAVRTVALYR